MLRFASLRVGARCAGRAQVARLSSGSHSDFETVRAKVPDTARPGVLPRSWFLGGSRRPVGRRGLFLGCRRISRRRASGT